MSDSLRDRIAAALYRSDHRKDDDWDTATEVHRKLYLAGADAVIAELGLVEERVITCGAVITPGAYETPFALIPKDSKWVRYVQNNWMRDDE